MNFGICHLSVIPVRSGASDKSEMTTQLLFGETVEILEKRASWIKIRCTWDNYIGWTDKKQIKPITPSEYELYQEIFAYNLELVQPIMGDEHYIPITMGAVLPNFDGMRLSLNGSSYNFSGQAVFPLDIKLSIDFILKIARKYLYAPYLWGGRSPLGIDCSGFTQMVFKIAGIPLPRDAYQQVEEGELVHFIEQSRNGDLAFFENRKGKITHVGMIINDKEIIHASGHVRIDKIDHYGIFNEDIQKYTHKLRVVKRILPTLPSSLSTATKEEIITQNQVELF